MNQTKLHRSSSDRVIAGVCGGIARTYNLDSALVRLLFVVATLLGFSGVLLYLIMWVVVPADINL